MATPENGTNMSEDLDIDALINAADVDEKDVSAVVSSLHQELNSVTKASGGDLSQDSGLGSTPEEASLSQQPVTSNGFQQTQEKVVLPPSASSSSSSSITTTTSSSVPPSLTPAQPVKTKGEVSTSISTATSSTPSSSRPGLTLNLSKTETSTQPQAQDSTNRRASLSTMSPFGGLTHGPQTSLLTIEEQSAIYKQASLLAIYAMSSKNGPAKAKEMLAVVTKVKNFLTNLVQLAGNSGPQVRTAVHSLVQKLVAGSITEEEFAKKIEQDLKSKHQPDLLPFLQASVPDLRTHLQIQKEYMKQLVDKKVQEKNGVNTTTVTQLTQGGTKLTQQQQINVILRQQQLIKEQQQQATLVLKGRVIGTSSSSSPQRSASPRKGGLTGLIGKLKTPGGKDDSPASPGGTGAKNKVQEDQDEEEDHIDNFAGVNLKEETAHFLPAASDTPTKSISDETFLSTALL